MAVLVFRSLRALELPPLPPPSLVLHVLPDCGKRTIMVLMSLEELQSRGTIRSHRGMCLPVPQPWGLDQGPFPLPPASMLCSCMFPARSLLGFIFLVFLRK